MDLTATKAVALVLLGVVKLLSGLAPLVVTKFLKKRSDRFLKKFIGVTLCFGGGVLLATVLLHMLKEVREVLDEAAGLGALPEALEEYPFAELMVGAGFLLILLIESVVHKFFGGHGHSHFPSQETLAKKFVAVEDARGRDNIGYDAETAPPVYSVTQPSISSASSSDSDTTAPASPEHQASNKDKKGEILSTLRSIMVVIALSVHSLFEGMAIGLEEENSGVWKLTLAITIHAIPIVFCVGTDMLTSGVKKMKLIIYIIVLSLNTPIGILIGIIVTIHKGDTDESGGHVLLIGILQGLAAGTLLYITFFEVLARDKLTKYGMSGLAGALAVMLGFALMGGMEAAGHGHSHGGGHGHAHDMGHHHGALSQAEGHLHMAHENHLHDHDEHDHDHDEHDHDEHGGHWGHDPEPEPHEDHDHDHEHSDEHDHDHDHDEDHDHDDHDHGDEHDHDDHDHEHEEHDHHDDDDIDADLIQIKSDDYFELNGTDYKFMHDM